LVEGGEFESPKLSKEHTKHELSAHLSTSTIAGSSPLVSFKYILESKVSSAEKLFLWCSRLLPNALTS
jgi:hypothetical protein